MVLSRQAYWWVPAEVESAYAARGIGEVQEGTAAPGLPHMAAKEPG